MHIMKMNLYLQVEISIKLVKFLKFSVKAGGVKDTHRHFYKSLAVPL